MIKKIAHLADIHIRKVPTRNEEYQKVFDNLIKSLTEKKPHRIVIVGDLVHDYLDLQGEQLIMAYNFLVALSNIAPVRITRGNHDCRKNNLKRVDSIKAIVKTLGDVDVKYYDKTGMYLDDNVTWAVWHHGEQKNNPWKLRGIKDFIDKHKDTTFIDLFHDPISGCKSTTGFEIKSNSYYKITDFKGDISMFGDIHRMQFMDNEQTKAYCGSLIAQDITEGDDAFHGYLLWDVDTKVAELVSIHNDNSFKNVRINQYTDFNDLDFEIQNPTTTMTVRFIWGTLPQTRTKENERKLVEYIKTKYPDSIIKPLHKNEFIESEKINVNENITLQNVTDKAVQHEIFKEFLSKIGCDEQLIKDVIAIDDEILNEINIVDDVSIEWDIVKFGGTNFMSYGQLDIDWRDKDGLFQITGVNTAGKTTIMKLISYILYNKTLETETRMKYGDLRFVNNRNNATSCDAYLVISANGEFFGIKKKTEIIKNKSGEIIGAPTTLNYYVLSNPDEEMTDENALEKLDEDRRAKTQLKLNAIIGSYDNFMRIVMTTSDTLNRILSNDMATFIDSLLYDSGLDIFDRKLEGWKIINKRINEKPRIFCDVEITKQQNATLTQEITTLEGEITTIETITLPDIQTRISIGRKYIEDLTKKLHKIDNDIYNLNVDEVRKNISINKKNIVEIKAREMVLKESIKLLKEDYDAKRLEELNKKRDEHKTNEYNQKLKIKGLEQIVRDEEHKIEIINGNILKLKEDGAKLKKEITELKNSKVCSLCGQAINKPEHIEHINNTVQIKENEMFDIARQINIKENVDKKAHLDNIQIQKDAIAKVQKEIETAALEMEIVLKEIGKLTNDKNDVEKRKELQTELDSIPIKIQNEELKISILEQKITSYENSLLQIEENQRIEKGIAAAKQKISILEDEESKAKEDIFIRKTNISNKQAKIKANNQLIEDFKAQEYRDTVMNLYKKCVHRDGIPRQILSNYIIPKINLTLENILSVAPFKVWLDQDDLRPKLVYNSRPTAIIDCISASGKERTFSSVVLKFALNQINVKAKPTIFLLDEVMGKLDENSVEEFVNILQLIKNNMKKVLVVEHIHEINPDYIINVQLNDDGISSLVLE